MRRIIIIGIALVMMMYAIPIVYKLDNIVGVEEESSGDKEYDFIESITGRDGEIIKVLVDDEVVEMTMADFLVGALAGEMPALFPEESLKAQAVAARSYTIHKKINAGVSEDDVHKGAIICNNPSHCKAYIDLDKDGYRLWGDREDEFTLKLQKAVSDTANQILTYDDKPIVAVFHSASADRTENAEDVWGNPTPYLISVESPGAEDSPRYEGEVIVSSKDAKAKILDRYPDSDLSGDFRDWFSDINVGEGGGVVGLNVGGVNVRGTFIRSIFGLNSTNFTITYGKDEIIFKTKGTGHGVGMSQYGARRLALDGKEYEEILQWYYPGTYLEEISS